MRLRGLRLPRNRCHRYGLIFAILLCGFLLYTILAVHKERCSDEESMDILARLCHEYRRKSVAGSLCDDICISRSIQYMKCLNYRKGKKIMIATWDDSSTIILKTKNMEIWDYDPIWYVVDSEKVFPSLKDFYTIMLRSYQYAFITTPQKYAEGLGIPTDKVGETFVQNLWNGMDFHSYITSEPQDLHQMSAFQSLYSLVQQDEYLTMQYFQDNQHIPQIQGTCGHIYAMEYAPSGNALSLGIKSITGFQTIPWHKRAQIGLGILSLIQSFNNISPLHGALHLCDIKNENFGVSDEGVVKAIDVDTAFVDEKMKEELSSPNCTHHKDCDFFDCWGWCNIKTQKCSGIRRNNNLQAVCQKVFISNVGNAMHGLLKRPPEIIRDDLKKRLEECITPTQWEEEQTMYIATADTLVQLKNLLHESLEL